MSRQLAMQYALYLTSDSQRCAALFAEDAEYITPLGGEETHLRGREAIHNFLQNMPQDITVSVTSYREEGGEHIAGYRIQGPDIPTHTGHWRFRVRDGYIARFQVVHE